MSAVRRVRGQVVRMSTELDRCMPSKPRVLCLVCARRLPDGSPMHRDRVTLDASAIELGAIGCRMWVGEVQPRLSQAGRAWVGRYFSDEGRRAESLSRRGAPPPPIGSPSASADASDSNAPARASGWAGEKSAGQSEGLIRSGFGWSDGR